MTRNNKMQPKAVVFNDFNNSRLAEVMAFVEKAERFKNERKRFRRSCKKRI